jgi:hypothetical protein
LLALALVVVSVDVRRCGRWHWWLLVLALAFAIVGISIHHCEHWCSSLLALAPVIIRVVVIGVGTHHRQWSLLLALVFVVIGVGVFSSLVLAFIVIGVCCRQLESIRTTYETWWAFLIIGIGVRHG